MFSDPRAAYYFERRPKKIDAECVMARHYVNRLYTQVIYDPSLTQDISGNIYQMMRFISKKCPFQKFLILLDFPFLLKDISNFGRKCRTFYTALSQNWLVLKKRKFSIRVYGPYRHTDTDAHQIGKYDHQTHCTLVTYLDLVTRAQGLIFWPNKQNPKNGEEIWVSYCLALKDQEEI